MNLDFLLKRNKAFFVYDLDKVNENVQLLRSLVPDFDRLFYSVKSNPHPLIIQRLSQFPGVGFDVSTEQELLHVLKQKVPSERITFSGPAKTNAAIAEIKKHSLFAIHIDSEEEYHLLNESNCKLTLRFPLEESYSQKVGLSLKVIEKILATSEKKRFMGFHIYIGRERADLDLNKKYIEQIKYLLKKYQDSFVQNPEIFWGAGFPPAKLISPQMLPIIQDCRWHIETGRSISSSVADYFVPVLTRKKRDKDLVIIDGGLQHLATHFSSPRFGQKNLEVHFFSKEGRLIQSSQAVKADIYGSLGVWHDLMVKDLEIPADLACGDWLSIANAGAYGITAATNQFIGSSFPSEYLHCDNDFQEIGPKNFLSYLNAGLYENSQN